jgi:hypothetical protein
MIDRKGYLEDFFDVYSSEHAKVNILSFSEVEDMYNMMHVHTLRVNYYQLVEKLPNWRILIGKISLCLAKWYKFYNFLNF